MIGLTRDGPYRHGRAASAWLTMVLLAMALLLSSACLQSMPSPTNRSPLDDYAERAMKTFDTPGMAVVIVADDKNLIHTYGVRRLGTQARVDAHTIFPLGSNTKAFTSTALAELVDQGKLHWSDRVEDTLPGFRMYDAYTSSEMTITDLLVQQHILDPLGMHDTQVSIDAKVPDEASLHAKISGPVRGFGTQSVLTDVMTGDAFAPAGALMSSAHDMGKWLQVQLDRGVMANDKRLFSDAASIALWTTHTLIPITPVPPPLTSTTPQFQAYALGFEVRDYRGHKIITHLGGVLGGISAVVIIPDKHVAFAVMINSEDEGTLFAMREHLLDTYLGLSSPDWITSYKKALQQEDTQALQVLAASKIALHPERGPSLPLAGYAGMYRDPWYGTITISKVAEELKISFDRSPGLVGTLEHDQYDTFRTHFTTPGYENAFVTFSLKPDGRVDQIRMKAISPLTDFSWDYQDLLFTPMTEKQVR